MSVEKGAAGINLELKNGQIFVRHSDGNFLLAHWITEAGDGDKIWNTINRMVKKNNGFRAGGENLSDEATRIVTGKQLPSL